MRATERMRRLEAQDARPSWWGSVRDVAYWLLHGAFVLALLFAAILLGSDDPSTVDDSLAVLAMAVVVVLGVMALGLTIAGAPPLPCASALLPACVLFVLPAKDARAAAAWTWLVVHVGVLLWSSSSSSRRRSR